MVGVGPERSEAPSSSARGGRGSIPPVPLRRALLGSMGTPSGPSLSASVPTGGRGRGGKKRGGREGRGRGRGRQAPTPSSPPPPADSPEHMTARVDPSEVEATGTPDHEPRVDRPSAHETPVPDASAHETSGHETSDQATSQETSGWGTWPDSPEGPSGHADGGGDPTDSEGEVAEGATIYQRGCTRLPSVPATREQRWLIFPDGER
jgi:hypothetical protein